MVWFGHTNVSLDELRSCLFFFAARIAQSFIKEWRSDSIRASGDKQNLFTNDNNNFGVIIIFVRNFEHGTNTVRDRYDKQPSRERRAFEIFIHHIFIQQIYVDNIALCNTKKKKNRTEKKTGKTFYLKRRAIQLKAS